MGEVIRLEDRRARRRPEAVVGDAVRAEFFFDLASPFTYLAAERVDRAFDEVTWTPACSRTLRCARDAGGLRRCRRRSSTRAEERAAALRLPLEWPERWPMAGAGRDARRALRRPAGPRRGVRARGDAARVRGRLRPRRPRDPDRGRRPPPGLRLDGCLQAAREERRDGAMEAASRRLLGAGADRLPALCGRSRGVFWGEDRVGDAAATARRRGTAGRRAASRCEGCPL